MLDLPTDPDAQATVTDFLDFTEYLPSDMIRSLTLVGKLDQTYRNASATVHELTTTLGQLPQLPTDAKPEPIILREDISENLAEAVRSRTLSHAEACRMADNVERHYNRAKAILSKLQAMAEAYPATREPTPVEEKTKSPQATRGPKITLRLDGAARTQDSGTIRVRKHRMARITVPGEVLAPYELDYESYFSDSEDWNTDDDDLLTPRQTPGRSLGGNAGRIKLKLPKKEKVKTPKPPRPPRPPGMGTNVHSSVAGISTSNALAALKPPPENAVLGSEDAPWLQLTAWELAKLRKRMKKNAVWSPSDTMIARELKSLGRGIEAYRLAKQKAESAGQPFESVVTTSTTDPGTGKKEGAISVDALGSDEIQLSNRGMKLNEAKKLKRENEAKELAKLAAEEAEESARKMAEAVQAMRGLFNPTAKNGTEEKKSPSKTPSKLAIKKRKRDSSPEIDADKDKDKEKDDGKEKEKEKEEEKLDASPTTSIRPQVKRTKTETPVPPPRTTAANSNKQVTPVPADTTTLSVSPPLVPSTTSSDIGPLNAQVLSPKKAATPILPPAKDTKRDQPSANTRRRGSLAATPTPVPEPLPQRRPDSSRGAKASSTEPVSTIAASSDRPRRASTARNTPAPEARMPSRRGKKPAPGVVTGGTEGSAAVSVGKRTAAPRKKAALKKKDGREGSAAAEAEIDDEGNIIDPNEPRYCLCNRVSFGTMIACENNDVSLPFSFAFTYSLSFSVFFDILLFCKR